MAVRINPARYGSVSQTLHWLVVGLLIVQFALARIAHALPLGPDKVGTLARHKSVGITILMLAILRLAWRWIVPPPPLPPMPRWQATTARVTHFAMYALLFAMPLTGWMMSSASNYPVSWFGLFQLPDLVGPDHDLKEALEDIHETFFNILATIAGLHVAAALKHQFIDRDGLLFRMLPWRSR